MQKKIICWIKKEFITILAFLLALVSSFFVPPSLAYLSYIDFRTLSLLFSMMLIISGFDQSNLFTFLAQKILQGEKQLRSLLCLLIFFPFVASMLITNDIALIIFVPFAIFILTKLQQEKYLIQTLVLQTIAANLGSMATPFGNPQNLFLYTRFHLSLSDFFGTLGPFVFASAALLLLCILFIPKECIRVQFSHPVKPAKIDLCFYCLLFLLCVGSTLRLLPYGVSLLITIFFILVRHPKLIKKADYSLLFTFVFLFIFSGNMKNIPAVQSVFENWMQHFPLLTTLVSSQLISNVPAAVFLSNFTNQPVPLLIGSNIGGLGTLVASLASLISFKFYIGLPIASPKTYIWKFTLYNFAFLILLFCLTLFV